MGFPDYRGARAIEVAFTGDLLAPEGEQPVRGGLVLPLLDEGDAQSLLGVLTREKGRHFSEEDVDALDGVVRVARSPVARALNLREADVVPEIDLLTNLLDRQSFTAVLEREIVRARLAGHPLSLLVLDVDRLTSLNARLGLAAATVCSTSSRSASRGRSTISTTRSGSVAAASPCSARAPKRARRASSTRHSVRS